MKIPNQYGCTKRAFSSKKEAKRERKLRDGGRKLHPYLCPFCGYWHLTKQRQKGAV